MAYKTLHEFLTHGFNGDEWTHCHSRDGSGLRTHWVMIEKGRNSCLVTTQVCDAHKEPVGPSDEDHFFEFSDEAEWLQVY